MAEFLASEEAKKIIAAHVATSGWQTEIGAMPKEPADVIMISDTGGLDPNPKWLLDFPTIQIMVRGIVNGYLVTAREAKAVKDLILGITSFTTSEGDRWVSATMNGDLGFIGRDENARPLFTMNIALIIEPLLGPNSNRLPLGGTMAFPGSGFSIGFDAGFG